MRIARAGETPDRGRSAGESGGVERCRGLARVALRLDRLDDARAGRAGERSLRLGLVPELVHLVVRRELAVGMLERGEHLPVGLRDVRAALQLALHHDRQGRALHTADGQELRPQATGRERNETSQRRAPDQVDVLARLAGASQRLGQLDEVGERVLDLLLGQRRVLGALDARRHRSPRTRCAGRGSRPASPRAPRGRSARPRGRSRSRSRSNLRPWPACAAPCERSSGAAPSRGSRRSARGARSCASPSNPPGRRGSSGGP